MHILLVTAHPNSKDSFTAALRARYHTLVKNNPAYTLAEMDLYDPQWQQEYFTFDSETHPDFKQTRERIQEAITRADELVFAHPLWWGSPPAVLKNWLDANLTSGFAYKHRPNLPKWRRRLWPLPSYRLLSGKSGKVFVTGDSPFWTQLLMGLPFLVTWGFSVFLYTGIRPRSLRYFGSMRLRSSEEIAKILETIRL